MSIKKKKIKETQYSVNSEVTAQTINIKPRFSFILPLLLGKYQQIIKSSFIETDINLF